MDQNAQVKTGWEWDAEELIDDDHTSGDLDYQHFVRAMPEAIVALDAFRRRHEQTSQAVRESADEQALEFSNLARLAKRLADGLEGLDDPQDLLQSKKGLTEGLRDAALSLETIRDSLKDLYSDLSVDGYVQAHQFPVPPEVDLTPWFPKVKDQGNIPSCTAQAATSLLEYCQMRASIDSTAVKRPVCVSASVRFLYKVALSLHHRCWEDLEHKHVTGLSARETFGALLKFGTPPAFYWPYPSADLTAEEKLGEIVKEPPPFIYTLARNYRGHRYVRLDAPDRTPAQVLAEIKAFLAAGVPSMCGFDVHKSALEQWDEIGSFAFPRPKDEYDCGHAVVAVGYDDRRQVPGSPLEGAFRIRNSWRLNDRAPDCEEGYGWLPYDYVLLTADRTPAAEAGVRPLARDWWALLSAEWIKPGGFGLGLGTPAANGG